MAETDNLIYEIEDFYMNKNMFDFSENLKYSRFYDVKNNKIIGKINHETHVVLVDDFVGLLIHQKR